MKAVGLKKNFKYSTFKQVHFAVTPAIKDRIVKIHVNFFQTELSIGSIEN